MSTTQPLRIPRVLRELRPLIGQTVTARGFVHRVRHLGQVTFVILRDGSGLLQIVYQSASDQPWPRLEPEMSVESIGTIVADSRAPGEVELQANAIRILSTPTSPTPIFLGGPRLEEGLAQRLADASVALRHPESQKIFRIQAQLVAAFRQYLTERYFVEVHTPKIISTATESGANVFSLPYFGRTAYLAQSPQLYKQMLVGVFGRVFEVGPVFRAEPHDTARHLSQYTSLDVEMGFISGPEDIMQVLNEVLVHMMTSLEDTLEESTAIRPNVPNDFPVIHFTEALTRLSAVFGPDVMNEEDLSPAHERWLGQWASTEWQSDFLFVTGYPMAKRPFYTCPDPDHSSFSQSFDLLFRGQEIVTGGQRLHRSLDYERALEERGLNDSGLKSYLSTFRYGMPPHGGFAIGLERLTAQLLMLSNIREATLFPRDVKRLVP